MDILEFLNKAYVSNFSENRCKEAAQEIERLRKERGWLKEIIEDAIKEIENPLNETEKQETLMRLYGAIDEGTLDMFG